MGRKPAEKIAAEPKNAEALGAMIGGADISAVKLGEICGVSRQTATKYLKEPSRIPAEYWADIANACDVSPSVFDDVVMRAGGIDSLLFELSAIHKERYSTPAPYGTAGVLYAYTALPERERAYLRALAATMLKEATERGETEPRIARDYLAAVFECGPLHYDLKNAAEAAGITDEDANAHPEAARAALIGQLPEADRMAIAEMERDSPARDAKLTRKIAEAIREQEQQAREAASAANGNKCDKAVKS